MTLRIGGWRFIKTFLDNTETIYFRESKSILDSVSSLSKEKTLSKSIIRILEKSLELEINPKLYLIACRKLIESLKCKLDIDIRLLEKVRLKYPATDLSKSIRFAIHNVFLNIFCSVESDVSFLSYLGSKKRMLKEIYKVFNKAPNFKTYIEPFGGSGQVILKLDNPSIKKIYNDRQKRLTTLLNQARDNLYELISEINRLKILEDYFYAEKDKGNKIFKKIIEDASNLFFVTNLSMYGNKRNYERRGNRDPSKLFDKRKSKLLEIAERLSDVQTEHRDFYDLLKKYINMVDILVYADPPYFDTEIKCGGFKESDHVLLSQILINFKGYFVLSYRRHPKLFELYGYSRFYFKEFKIGKNVEVLITNFKVDDTWITANNLQC